MVTEEIFTEVWLSGQARGLTFVGLAILCRLEHTHFGVYIVRKAKTNHDNMNETYNLVCNFSIKVKRTREILGKLQL